ncbi:MAG TPA: phosphatidylglycerol lysyltransferase domain-containing protein [Myxococcales bacterium]
MRTRLGLNFETFDLSQAGELSAFLNSHPQPLSGYTVGMLAAWDPIFHYEWSRPEPEALIISCTVDPEPDRHLIQPVGTPSESLLQQVADGAAQMPYALKVYGVSPRFMEAHPAFVARFRVDEEPIADNYIYRVEDLATLAGRKYSAKRNHISQAAREYRWDVRALSEADADGCVALARELYKESTLSESFRRDLVACEIALRHLEKLRLRGTVVQVEGKIVAFAVWERLEPKTAVVHFERALRTYKGLYQVLNQETAKVMQAEGFELVNREEDLGDEGLRKAKLSYHPLRLEKAYTLTIKR